ncbi:DUF2892 domain-containing protein [Aquimarina sp. I32.4]
MLSISGVLILTGFMGWCPIYRFLGIKTCRI